MDNPKYSRLKLLKVLSEEDLRLVRTKKVAIIGIGGTGSMAADLFARSGVSSLKIVDRDYVSITNLHRQVLYTEKDIGEPKVEVAKRRLESVNSDTKVDSIQETFDASNAERILKSVDLVIDGTDNMTTRMIINDACVKHNIPWIHASAIETYGQVKAIIPGKTSCLSCYYPQDLSPQPTCAEVGVLSSVPNIISALSWTLGLKILAGKDVSGDLFHIDAWAMEFEHVPIGRKDGCRSCANHDFVYLSDTYKNLGIRPLV